MIDKSREVNEYVKASCKNEREDKEWNIHLQQKAEQAVENNTGISIGTLCIKKWLKS